MRKIAKERREEYRGFYIYPVVPRRLYQVCDWDYEGEYERGHFSSREKARHWIDGCVDG